MRVIYLSSVCAQGRFDQLVNQGRIDSQFQNQKFHHLILNGLAACGIKDVFVVSYYPVLEKDIKYFEGDAEVENGINYIYPSFTKKPVDGFFSRIVSVYQSIKSLYTDDSTIVCNIMNFEACIAARLFRSLHRTKIIAITADVPGIVVGERKKCSKKYSFVKRLLISGYQIINKWICLRGYHSYDGYVFLTEAMDEVVNTHHRPYIVMEGLADRNALYHLNSFENKYEKRTIVYAGGLKKEYGSEVLVKAFQKLPDSDLELHLYGYGTFVSELQEYCKKDSRIKYLGVKSNNEITEILPKAHLLINPRPTNQEFVKYSFPSKIMEYMSSGTPLLTTIIPGMPKEYYPFVYLIEDESVDGVCHALKKVLEQEDSVLKKKGEEAQSFIIEKKNNVIQASRILDFIKKIQS